MSKSVDEKHNVLISVQGKDHFLYLPLFYAESTNFFGLIPDRYSLSTKLAEPAIDLQVVTDLLRKPKEYWFGVGDPMALMDIKVGGNLPAVLAAIVTNSGFLAVNHGFGEPKHFEDLSNYSRFVAYSPDTTSHGIARRLARIKTQNQGATGNGDELIEVADVGKELDDLLNEKEEVGVLVLTPDLLKVNSKIERGEVLSIEMELGRTPEYQHVLSTALMSREDIVYAHPELTKGLLRAIQQSMNECRSSSEAVVEYALQRYGKEGLVRSLAQANRLELWPASLKVFESDWIQAMAAKKRAESYRAVPEEEIKRDAHRTYMHWVAPHTDILQRSRYGDSIPDVADKPLRTMQVKLLAGFLALVLFGVSSAGRWANVEWLSSGAFFFFGALAIFLFFLVVEWWASRGSKAASRESTSLFRWVVAGVAILLSPFLYEMIDWEGILNQLLMVFILWAVYTLFGLKQK